MNEILKDVDRARKGDVISIPFGHNKLSRYIFLGQKLYHLIGGAGGSGKSAWVDLNYVIQPALWVLKYGKDYNIRLKIVLRSMERSKKHRMAKWVCMKLFIDHKILIDVPTLFGWGSKRSRIGDDLFNKIKQAIEDVEKLEDIVEVVDGIDNPTGIYLHLRNDALKKGTLYRYTEQGEFIKQRGTQTLRAEIGECPTAKPYQPVYIPDDNREINLDIVDHLQAMKNESGFSDKQNLDKMSEYARVLRDLYGRSPVMVSQLNRNVGDTMRRIQTDLLPEDRDFSGSSNMYFDCDMAAILFNPYKYGLKDLVGWKVNNFVDKEYGINRFRSFHLLKNTYGPDNQIIGYNFIGENGLFRELVSPDKMQPEHYEKCAYVEYSQRITSYQE